MRISKVSAPRKVALLAVLTFVLLALQGAFDTATAQTFHIDHFKVYQVAPTTMDPFPVVLEDQFGTEAVDVNSWEMFAAPVDKNFEGFVDPGAHQTWYWITDSGHPLRWLQVTNQFGTEILQVQGARFLVNPAWKETPPGSPPLQPNHFKCYEVVDPPPPVDQTAHLETQFGFEDVNVLQALFFCNPVSKNGEPIIHLDDHLTCYDIDPKVPLGIVVVAQDQFGPHGSILEDNRLLCVPSHKTELPAPVCCENQNPVNGAGTGDGLGAHPPPLPADLVTQPFPPNPGCTVEASVTDCWSYDNLQVAYPYPAAQCTGVDPDGAGNATGSFCNPPSNPDPEQPVVPVIPALSRWGLIVFLLLLATGGMLILRRRPRAPSV